MKLNLILALLALAGGTAADDAVPLDAVKTWTIVLAPDATPSERYAADEFRTLFQQALGVDLPVSSDAARRDHVVLLGPGASGLAADGFGEEELLIRVTPRSLTITGGRPRGTLYGVYEFFEEYLGCEFLTYDQTWFPPTADLKPLSLGDHAYTPPFSFRWSYYKENSDHPEFATRQRINTVATDDRLGGKTPQNLIGHSYYRWINADSYGQSHPEYFALVDGVRQLQGAGGGPEPCVSNPEVIDIIARGVLEELERDPSVRNIAVSQNDNAAYCRCPTCEDVNQREGTPMGANLALVNAVADRVAQAHPEVNVGTLAYWYTRRPPKSLRPRDNVQIQLCSIECCSLHPINDPDCPLNRTFCEDLQGWKALSNEIWIWNYNTNFSFYDLPFPNLKSIGPNVKFFLDNNAKGVFMQANGNGNAGEFCDLRNYVISKCLWKPGRDSWTLAERFCRLHYGAAADDILEYQRMIHRVAEKNGAHPDCGPPAERIGLTADVSHEAVALFQRALDKAEDDTVRARVEKASICAYKALLLTLDTSWKYENGSVKRVMPDEYAGVLETYTALCRKYHMTMHAETVTLDEFLDKFRTQSSIPAAAIENGVWRVAVTPGHNGAAVSLYHKPSGRELLRAMQSSNIEKGILETFVQTGPYRRVDNLECTAETEPGAIVLTKKLPDGTVEKRAFRLDDAAHDKLRVEFTVTQGGAAQETWRFYSQTGFHPGTKTRNADVLSVYVLDGDWKVVNRDWMVDKGPDADLLKKVGGGGFAFFNHEARFGARMTFNPQEAGELYMFWHPERPQLNMEIRTPKATLQPGQGLHLAYTIEYLDNAPGENP